jgi:hypothetical protein
MGIIKLSNHHHFVKEAANVGVFYEELLEACECSGTQKISRMFSGKSIRGGQGHASGVTIDNWLFTFKFALDNPDVLDNSPYQARNITPTKEWYDYLEIIRKPIDTYTIDRWKSISNKVLGDEAENIGITKGIRNTKSVTTLLARMEGTVDRRRKCIWNIDRSALDTTGKLDYRYSNVSQVHQECQKRNIPICRQSKDTLIELVQTFDQNPQVTEEITNYAKMNKTQLHVLCKDRGFIMYNKLNKDALRDLLVKNDTKIDIHVDIEKGAERDKISESNLIVTQYSLELSNGSRSLIPIRSDGYIDATAICKAGNKQFSDWSRLGSSKALVQVLSNDIGIPVDRLIETCKGGDLSKVIQGSFAHPRLALNIAQWISTEFKVEVSRWVEEWRGYNDNDTRYRTSLNRIKPEYNNSHVEKDIQHRLHKDMGGEIEVRTTIGYIDLLTDTMLIEIKEASQWKHGLGQVLCYSKYESRESYRLHLFGELPVSKEDIENTCGGFGVVVTYE